MSFSISGKSVIVTGAANGIGLAIARQFADKGANVMCADIDEKALVEQLGDAKDDGNIRFFAGDLRQRLTIANLVSATIDAFDEVDVLVNASRQFLPTDALDSDDTSVETLWQENVMTAAGRQTHDQTVRGQGRGQRRQHRQPQLDHLAAHTARVDGLFHGGGRA